MTTQEIINELKSKHKDLELDLMEADFGFDELRAQQIKKEKLRIKDEIERLTNQRRPT